MRVAVIGTGTMGLRMVEALLRAGYEVLAHDASEEARERATKSGAKLASSAAEAAAGSRVALLSLPSPGDVEDAVAGKAGILSGGNEGMIIADTSTVDPATSRRLSAVAERAGIGYLDAPILGRPDACGHWTMPVGGTEDILEKARPILEAFSEKISHVGPPGSGNAIKLLNNLMFGAINAITVEAFALAVRAGVSQERFYETVAESGAATVSPLFQQVGRKIIEGDFSPTFTVDLLHKDNALAMKMAEEAQAPLIVGDSVTTLHRLASSAGYGSEDTSAVIKLYETLHGPRAPKG